MSSKEVLGVHSPLTSVVRVSVLTTMHWLPSSLCLSNRTNGTRCFNLCFVSCEWSCVSSSMFISHVLCFFYVLALPKAQATVLCYSGQNSCSLSCCPGFSKRNCQPRSGDCCSWRDPANPRSLSPALEYPYPALSQYGTVKAQPLCCQFGISSPWAAPGASGVLCWDFITAQLLLCSHGSFPSPVGTGPQNTPKWPSCTLFSISKSASQRAQHSTLILPFVCWSLGPFLNDLKTLCLGEMSHLSHLRVINIFLLCHLLFSFLLVLFAFRTFQMLMQIYQFSFLLFLNLWHLVFCPLPSRAFLG